MSEQHKKAHIGAQNDALFIIVGEAPASNNDYPRHDADRTAIAKVYDEDACRRLVACWNACESVSLEDLEAINRPADVSFAMNVDRLVRERDELLAALKLLTTADSQIAKATDGELESALDDEDKDVRDQANAFLVARAAIAKAEGT
jgi:hypothetical protein